ncbi:LuxR family quorum sensing-dependent transcriptional regulator [Rhizobium aquaticum]|uniref:LuxR family quorum sensing-dependent transcriptional regulator n=1 Tax=Rhizobium aquaticum TaxID=1549636 RepID=A0ABV2J873_9HYPH
MGRKEGHESPALWRMAFEFIDKLNQMKHLNDVLRASSSVAHDFGFDAIALVDIPSKTADIPFKVLIDDVPAGWIDHYTEHKYAEKDPILRWSVTTGLPFEWSEARHVQAHSDEGRVVMQRAADFGMRHGFSLSVRHSDAPMNCLSMASTAKPHIDATTKPLLHLMSTYAIMRAHVLRTARPVFPELSPREREVLTWVAIGKTSDDIADTLGLTSRTVVAHITNASRKLGALNRTHAVAKAATFGLINI